MISSAQISKYLTVTINNINFDLVVDKNGDTTYIQTKDKNFVTPEGFRIGTTFEQIPNDLTNVIVRENGWGYYVTLDSKWALGFCEGSSCTDSYPADSSVVKWIFKRR
jgi:hypothetical protein